MMSTIFWAVVQAILTGVIAVILYGLFKRLRHE